MEAIRGQFTNEDLIKWRGVLEKRKKLILETQDSLKRHALTDFSAESTGELSKARLHPADLASDIQELETLETLSERNIKSVKEFDDAMERIDKGSFGLCLSCGESIAIERLKAIPESGYCVDCQKEFEILRKTQKEVAPRTENLGKLLQQGLSRMGRVAVADIMQENPISVKMGDSITSAADLLADYKIRHLPVVDDKGDIQGIISNRDLLSVIREGSLTSTSGKAEVHWTKKTVGEVMTKTPETISAEADLFDAGTILLDNKISCLPVVEGNRLIGIITESDFVKLVSQSI
jgi:CBS domain-containing protein/RNA polymerase-binding transcription factor DksA